MTKKDNLLLILSPVMLYSIVALLSLSTNISAVNFRGFAVNDVITGTRSQDTINAVGEEGDDVIYGGIGEDTLSGRKGSDLIFCGPGVDTISGSPEADMFDCGLGKDSVIDFNELEGDFARNNCDMSL